MTDTSTPFPPRDWRDVEAYPDDEVLEGYLSYEREDPEPGQNRSPGFRWGYANRKKDATGENDGFDWIRADFLRETAPWRRAAMRQHPTVQ